jgi:uncharacterized membrane protein SpoIIM required for sporulation
MIDTIEYIFAFIISVFFSVWIGAYLRELMRDGEKKQDNLGVELFKSFAVGFIGICAVIFIIKGIYNML